MEDKKWCPGPACALIDPNGLWKPFDSFTVNNNSLDGYELICKQCKVYKKLFLKISNCINCKKKSDKPICSVCVKHPIKICTTCNLTKYSFHPSRLGYQYECTDCKFARTKRDTELLREMANFYAKNLLMD